MYDPTLVCDYRLLDLDWEHDYPTPAEALQTMQHRAEQLEAEEEHIGLIIATILLDGGFVNALKTEQRK